MLPLQTRLRESKAPALRDRYQSWTDCGLAELGMAVATKFSLTYRVAFQFAGLLKRLRDEIEESGEIEKLLDGGYVYTPADSRIFYDICVAVDAFFFEYRSCYEVVGRFVTTFGSQMLNRELGEGDLLEVLAKHGVATQWAQELREHRKLFFHETAPWIALRISQRRPLECSLLVMKDNLREFSNPNAFITQQQISDTARHFQDALWAIKDWLMSEISVVEAALIGSAS